MAGALLALTMMAGAPARAMTPADADLLRDGVFASDRDGGVAARPHPDYAPRPLRVGAFDLVPSLAATAAADDNVYAGETDRRGDVLVRVSPALRAASTWGRHALIAAASLTGSAYARLSGEDTVDSALAVDGRYDAGRRLVLTGGGRISRETEARTDTASQTLIDGVLAHPIRYDRSDAYLGAAFDDVRYRLSGRLEVMGLSYDDGRAYSGASLYQRDRDHTASIEVARADYVVGPGATVFARATFNQRAFRNPALGEALRSSHGYEVQLGVHLGLSHLVQGEAAVGTLAQSYDARLYSRVAGLSFDGRLRWLPTQLTTVTVSARRAVEDTGIPNVSGALATRFGARVDHELLRSLLLTASLSRTRSAFRGYDRQDANNGAHIGARYLMNRAVTVNLAFDRLRQSSTGKLPGARFTVDRLSAALTYAL